MSVIVMGVDLPEDCDSCWLPGKHCNLWLATDVGERHRGCPIHQLPEKHGRLGDLDELKTSFADSINEGTGGQKKMAEYIEKQAVFDELNRLYDECIDNPTRGAITELEDIIKEWPAADVRPVVRSHWKKNDNGTYSCERCHSWIPEEQRHYANWCLYCGADMRGGDAE